MITAEQRNLDFLKDIVGKIWKVIVGAESFAQSLFPQFKDPRYPDLPEKLTFLHAEEILDMYPNLPRKQRETEILQKYPAVFIIGIGWPLRTAIRTRCAPPTTTTGSTDTSAETGQRYARAKRRHPRVEPRNHSGGMN